MLSIGDKVNTATNDVCDNLTGFIRETWDDGYTVDLEKYPEIRIGFWFGFDEVRKVEQV